MKHNKGNYRDVEDLNPEEEEKLYTLGRLVKDYEEMSEKANDKKFFHDLWNKYRKELEDYKKEIGIV